MPDLDDPARLQDLIEALGDVNRVMLAEIKRNVETMADLAELRDEHARQARVEARRLKSMRAVGLADTIRAFLTHAWGWRRRWRLLRPRWP